MEISEFDQDCKGDIWSKDDNNDEESESDVVETHEEESIDNSTNIGSDRNAYHAVDDQESASIYDIPGDVKKGIFEFVGDKEFLSISLVSKEFHTLHSAHFPNCHTSFMGSVSNSVECAKICFDKEDEDVTSS